MRKQSKRSIKRTAAFGLALTLAFALCACGEDTDEAPGPVTPVTDGAQTEDADGSTASEDSAVSSENTEAPEASAQEPDETGSETDETAVTFSEDPASSVTITMQPPEKKELTTEDGTVYYTAQYSYPVVSIEGNDAAAEKINADISAQMETVRADGDTAAKEALEWLNSLNESGVPLEPGDFRAYSDDVSYSVQRADDRVISLTVNYYTDAGGAHGYTFWRGAVYDTQTGERLTLDDLSDDPEAFRAATLAYNQELAATDSYSERMFSTEDITNGTLEKVLYEEENVWYLSGAGLVFVSDAYDLGSYADGAIEFIIPYRDLPDMGFREAYAYDGRLIMPLAEKQEYTADLNGDGTEETISLYNESLYDEASGVSTTVNHLLIDGTDFADAVSDALPETTWSYLVLFNLDTADDYLEFALCGNYAEGDEYPPYSQFFRYGKDKSLIYLGKTAGYANDTASVIKELTR